jgi:hypothetical protein
VRKPRLIGPLNGDVRHHCPQSRCATGDANVAPVPLPWASRGLTANSGTSYAKLLLIGRNSMTHSRNGEKMRAFDCIPALSTYRTLKASYN